MKNKYQVAKNFIVRNVNYNHIKKLFPDMDEMNLSLDYFQELIDKQDKYRWHDLRKDPNDLPNETGRKYTITQCGNKKYHVANWNGTYFGDWSTLFDEDGILFTPYASVDKWKEIEEFE